MYLFRPSLTSKDISAVTTVLKSRRHWANGTLAGELEKKLAEYLKSKYAVVCNSGTSALHAAMLALEISDYDEVIVPSFTFISTANAPAYVGATPVFADIEDETYGLDANDVLKKITDKTKAIIIVHYAGRPARDLRKIREIANDYNLFLIEDCCESMGADCGKLGDISCWSFCQNKIISTGDGGCLTTNNKSLYSELKLIVNLGKQKKQFVSLGYNWRLSEMQCALGITQLAEADNFISKRRKNSKLLSKLLGTDYYPESVYQLFTLRKTEKEIRKLKKKLDIPWGVYFNPVHLSKYYQTLGYSKGSLPVTERVSKEVITLPMYPDLTRKDLAHIADNVWTALS